MRDDFATAGRARALVPVLPLTWRGRRAKRTCRAAPVLESLEPIALMAAGAPVISGYVFLDRGGSTPGTADNGLLDPGEPGIGGASVQLFDSAHKLIGATATAADGSYAFTSDDGKPLNLNLPSVTTPAQSLSIGDPARNQVQTDFANQPLAPAMTLFDPILGTLTAVTVQPTVHFESSTTAQNLSPNAPATITPTLHGTYDLEGLNRPLTGSVDATSTAITVPPFNPANPAASTATFPTITATSAPQATTLTDPSSLAFFTASAGRGAIIPTLSATASGSGNQPNGNLTTTVTSSAAATVSVSYTYTPANNALRPGTYTVVQAPEVPNVVDGKESQGHTNVAPPDGPPQQLTVNLTTADAPANDFAKLPVPTSSPTVASLVRVGIHRQPTALLLTFNGPVDPALAPIAANYTVLASGRRIAIRSAAYNAAANAVTLLPIQRLNAHYHLELSVKLPSASGATVIVPFGGKQSLIGYFGADGTFVPITNGVIGQVPVATVPRR